MTSKSYVLKAAQAYGVKAVDRTRKQAIHDLKIMSALLSDYADNGTKVPYLEKARKQVSGLYRLLGGTPENRKAQPFLSQAEAELQLAIRKFGKGHERNVKAAYRMVRQAYMVLGKL